MRRRGEDVDPERDGGGSLSIKGTWLERDTDPMELDSDFLQQKRCQGVDNDIASRLSISLDLPLARIDYPFLRKPSLPITTRLLIPQPIYPSRLSRVLLNGLHDDFP